MDLKYFEQYFDINETEEKILWQNSLFVFDTSALLELYYYSNTARKEIINKVLKPLNNRLFVPYHSMYEYLKNRKSTIKKPFTEKYDKLKKESLNGIKDEIISISNKLEDFQQKTKSKDIHPFVNQTIFAGLKKSIKQLRVQFESFESKCEKEFIKRKKELEIFEVKDEIYSMISKLFITLPQYEFEELEKIFKNGNFRFENRISPGFNDALGKNQKTGIQKFGDLIIWNQIIEFAKEKQKPILFITNDVKDDWCVVEKRSNEFRIVKPKDDLLIEFSLKTKKQFWMYSFGQFLYKSKEFANSSLTQSSIEEVQKINTNIYFSKQLRFDGLYCSIQSGYNHYLKFHNDGTVAGVSALIDDASHVNKWIDNNVFVGRGNYSFNNSKLHFILRSMQGDVEYNGIIEENSLTLEVKSYINGNFSEDKYIFQEQK